MNSLTRLNTLITTALLIVQAANSFFGIFFDYVSQLFKNGKLADITCLNGAFTARIKGVKFKYNIFEKR